MFALDDATREAQYQMYSGMDENVFQPNLRVAEIQGPAKKDTSMGTFAAQAGANLLTSMYSSGTFSKGGAMDLSASSGGFSGLFKRTFSNGGSGGGGTGAGFELGSNLL
jgi:hypothetical protein